MRLDRLLRGMEWYRVLGVRFWRRWVEADMIFRCKACPVNVHVPCIPADRASMIRLMRQHHAAWRAQEDDPAAAYKILAAWKEEQAQPTGDPIEYEKPGDGGAAFGRRVLRGLNQRIRPPVWDMVPAIWGVPTPAPTLHMSREELRRRMQLRRVVLQARQSRARWEGK